MSSYLITGSSRGLGLCLATILAARPVSQVRFIAATARSTTPDLQALTEKHPGRVVFVPLNVTDQESVQAAVVTVGEALGSNTGLDCLINNAGVLSWTPGGAPEMTDLMSTLDVNVSGPQNITTAFLPLLRKGSRKLVINVSSTMGSITLTHRYGTSVPAYNISKAALNMLTVQWALALAKEGFTVMAISPGWLKTDLGGEAADLPVEVGANAFLDIVDHATQRDNGKSVNIHVPEWSGEGKVNQYDGGEVPW